VVSASTTTFSPAVAGRQPAPAGDFELVECQVILGTAYELGVGRAITHPQFETEFAHRHCTSDVGNVRENSVVVGAQQAVALYAAVVVVGVAGGGGLLTAHDDVRRSQFLDLLLRALADPFAHRHQPDHGGRADEDPQRGQPGAHLLQTQTLETQANRLKQSALHVAMISWLAVGPEPPEVPAVPTFYCVEASGELAVPGSSG
jgi:hypothetical protein